MAIIKLVEIKNVSPGTISFHLVKLRPGESHFIRAHLLRHPRVRALLKSRKLDVISEMERETPVMYAPEPGFAVKPEEVDYTGVEFTETGKASDISDQKETVVDLTTSKPIYTASEDLALESMTKSQLVDIAKTLSLPVTKKTKEELILDIEKARTP